MDDMSKIWIKNEIQMSVEEGWAWNSDLGQSHISVDWAVGGFSGTQNLKLLVPKKIGSSCFHNVGFPGPKKWKLWDQNVLLISFLSHAPVAIHDRHYINGSKIGQHLITNGVYIMFVCLFVCLLYTGVTNVHKALGNGSIWFTVTFWVNLRAWTMTAL